MEQAKVGRILGDEELVGRDAIHIAIAPVVASCPIRPGSHVRFTGTREATWAAPDDVGVIGIADPFLTETIQKGQRFYLFLYPGTITSLRHVWAHPAFRTKTVEALHE